MGIKNDAVKLIELLTKSIDKCTEGTKTVAVQLSGGLDSAIVQALTRSRLVYCITWPEEDNISTARLASCGAEVRPVTFTYEEMLEVLPEVARLTDGEGTWTQVCQWFCARQMAEDGVTLVLNGEGSDELFWGYPRYKVLKRLDANYSDPKLADYQDATVYKVHGSPRDAVVNMLSRTMSPESARMALTNYEDFTRGCAGAMASVEENVGLKELIEFERIVAEAHGIEHKWPFIDPDVVSFAHSLDPDKLITETHCKAVVRRAAAILGVNTDIVNETTKKGLFIPQSWRPENEPKWSRKWFTELMKEAFSNA
jgi:asparagine synthetase B (glutamine-hydrolysing)